MVIAGCEKSELPVKAYDRGDIVMGQVSMDPSYKYQVWYDLGTNREVKRNLKTDWDIAFDCREGERWIILNTSLGMKAAITTQSELNLVNGIGGLNFKPDFRTGIADSLALGAWWNHGKVCVIDRGYDEAGNALGFRKIKFISELNGIYTIAYANLDGSNAHTVLVSKNNLFNYVAFSFNTNASAFIEPQKTDYDLCFTQYTFSFYNPVIDYLVTGVFINTWQTQVAADSLFTFNQIDAAQIPALLFLNQRDAIGYDWKELVSISTGQYVVHAYKNYVIKDSEGFYFKLHFVDFYNDQGVKGNPKFEFRIL